MLTNDARDQVCSKPFLNDEAPMQVVAGRLPAILQYEAWLVKFVGWVRASCLIFSAALASGLHILMLLYLFDATLPRPIWAKAVSGGQSWPHHSAAVEITRARVVNVSPAPPNPLTFPLFPDPEMGC